MRDIIGPLATPDQVHLVNSLPKTRSGKIMRRVLKAILMDKPIGDVSTLEDEASVEKVKREYEKFKRQIEPD